MTQDNSAMGKVYLVGAGPGDPGLLTLKGKTLLERADVVFYDYLVHPRILEFCPQARQVYVGKVGHGPGISQKEIEMQLIEAAHHCGVVVRLKGGDPFIFGRGGEEAEALDAAGIPFEIVPGVSSAIAVPAYAGIPLTHREWASEVIFKTGHEDLGRDGDAGVFSQEEMPRRRTWVFLMGVKTLRDRFSQLIYQGISPHTPAAMIQWGTYPLQRTLTGTLQTLPQLAEAQGFEPPCIVVVGEVVKLRDKLRWFEEKPLFGKRILVTRAAEQGSDFRLALEEQGAWVVDLPCLEIVEPRDLTPLRQAIDRLDQFQGIVFASVNAVKSFFSVLQCSGRDPRNLCGVRLFAVGPATSRALGAYGLSPDHLAPGCDVISLAQSLPQPQSQRRSLLWPRAEGAPLKPLRYFVEAGYRVDVVDAYANRVPRIAAELLREAFSHPLDVLTFASPSAVKHLLMILQGTPYLKELLKTPCVVIGKTTQKASEQAGFSVVAVAKEPTLPDLVDAIGSVVRV